MVKAKHMTEFFHPKLLKVKACQNHVLETQWSTGETLYVDVAFVLQKNASLHPLLDPKVFSRVHIADVGQTIEWFDSELAADNVYAWAIEQKGQISHQMFDEWMHRNRLSLTTAADALGISRRMVSYYRTAQHPIPKSIWLACIGWEVTASSSNCQLAQAL